MPAKKTPKKKSTRKRSEPIKSPVGDEPSPIKVALEAERAAKGGPVPAAAAPAKPKPELALHHTQKPLPSPEVGDDGEFNPIRVDGKEDIPIYNPNEAPVTFQYGGNFFTVKAKGVNLVPRDAADFAVGEDNVGGKLLGMGLRRLYCNEERFYESARQACMPWYEWVEKRNKVVKQMADLIAAGNPYIEELQKLEIPKYTE